MSKLLEERQSTHGLFVNNALISQGLKRVARNTVPGAWEKLTPVQQEAIENMFLKVSRILSGNQAHLDHWRDIEGYVRRVIEDLTSEMLQ